MAFYFTNKGLYTLMSTAISGSTDLRVLPFTGTVPSQAAIADWDYLQDAINDASSAPSAFGSARYDLGSVTLTENDGPDTVTLTAAAPSWTSVTAGETWTFLVYYIYNAADTAAEVIGVDDPPSDLVTNGGNVTGPALSITLSAGAGNFTFTNRGLYLLMSTAISGSTDLRVTPFTGTKPSAATVKDWNTMQNAFDDATSAESTFGSARYDLGSVTLTEVDTGTTDNVTLTAAAPTWTAVTAGETWTFVVYYIHNATIGSAEVVAVDLTTSGQVTNGSDISYSALSVTIND